MVEFGQGFRSISPAAKDFEKKTLAGETSHNGNPVLSWMMACTTVQQDANGNIKPVKPERHKSGRRIDAILTSIMALDRLTRCTDTPSVYGQRGIIVL
jgi:phage terminase large subunit-like protein